MKVIQSFWTKPVFHHEQNFHNNRKIGGWLEYKYFLMSNCLSCLCLQRYHPQLELFTDSKGYDIFIEQLDLPYKNVSRVLDELENEDHRLWVLGKLKVIKLQKDPFVHVDNDVFIWDPLPSSKDPDFLISQSKHPVPTPYQECLAEVQKHFVNIPHQLTKKIDEYTNIVNIGLLGGNDMDFFQNYCDTAYNFLETNRENFEKITIGSFNQILDEFFMSCLLNARKGVYYHVDSSNESVDLDSMLRFHLTPLIDKYIHLLGVAKRNKYACRQMELRLKYEFPHFHVKVLDILASDGINPDGQGNEYEKLKENRIYTAIQNLYSKSLAEIKNIKIQLYDNYKLLELPSDGPGEQTKFILEETDLITGKKSCKDLPKADRILFYFEEPITINELIEGIQEELNGLGYQEKTRLQENILNSVMEKAMTMGILALKS